MPQFKKQQQSKFWHSPLALGVLFCLVVLFMYNMIGLIQKERETSKKKALILDQIDTLHAREATLNSDIARLNTEEGVEGAIREKYQVVKPGEKMVIIVDEKEKAGPASDESKDHTFWGFIKRMFGK